MRGRVGASQQARELEWGVKGKEEDARGKEGGSGGESGEKGVIWRRLESGEEGEQWLGRGSRLGQRYLVERWGRETNCCVPSIKPKKCVFEGSNSAYQPVQSLLVLWYY